MIIKGERSELEYTGICAFNTLKPTACHQCPLGLLRGGKRKARSEFLPSAFKPQDRGAETPPRQGDSSGDRSAFVFQPLPCPEEACPTVLPGGVSPEAPSAASAS